MITSSRMTGERGAGAAHQDREALNYATAEGVRLEAAPFLIGQTIRVGRAQEKGHGAEAPRPSVFISPATRLLGTLVGGRASSAGAEWGYRGVAGSIPSQLALPAAPVYRQRRETGRVSRAV